MARMSRANACAFRQAGSFAKSGMVSSLGCCLGDAPSCMVCYVVADSRHASSCQAFSINASTERIEGACGILTIRGDLNYSATLRFRQVPGATTMTPERRS